MHRTTRPSLALAALGLLFAVAAGPVAAECQTRPEPGAPIDRPFVFTATVREVSTEPDLDALGPGEVPGTRWHTVLDVGRVYRGAVPPVLDLAGTTSTLGVGGGCTWFLGDRVESGDVVLVALDELIPFATNDTLFGNLLLWRKVGDGWRFYERALQDGGEPEAYPEAARAATTTGAILRLVEDLSMPQTSAVAVDDVWILDGVVLGLAGLAGGIAGLYLVRRAAR